MTCLEWAKQITALREGKLRLAAPGEDGLSLYARGRFDDLIEYLKALEHGYRAVCETLDGYRKRERVRPALRAGDKSLQELVDNQWSNDAAIGYAAMGMRSARIRPDQAVLALDAMMEAMEQCSLDEAREYERGLRESDAPTEARDDGDGGQGSGRPTGTADGEMPRVLGPSAEFVPEG